MRIPQAFTEEVRSQADIVRLVSDYVSLKKTGKNYTACCPFHSEKTPSFSVNPGKGLYNCFGCGAGGDIFTFVMQIEGCAFPEALRIVAQKSGVAMPVVEESEDHKRVERDRETVLKLNQWAAEFFEAQLMAAGPESESARDYVASRGITEQARRLFRIGYAPNRWDGLIDYLKERGASTDEVERSGLAGLKESGGLYDRFRGRVIFPIADPQGRIIAFGGRVMGEGEPKYLNSPETALYTKGRNLFGLGFAKDEIRKLGFAILVEGYLDCIIPYQEGVHNIVGSLGTALTESQVRLLRRYMEKPQIVVNFDPDSAGQAATMRSIEMLLTEGFKVNILRMPTAEDPDEFVRNHGVAAFRALFKKTQPYIDYIIDVSIGAHDTSRPSGKVEAINAILPHLARMRDKVARADYAEQIADRLKVDSRVIREEIKRVATTRQPAMDAKRLRAAQEMTKGEHQLLELLLASAEVRRAIVPNLRDDDYGELATASIFTAIATIEREGLEPDFQTLSERVEAESERGLLPRLLMSDLAWARGQDFDNLFKEATEALASLRRKQLERQLDAIQIEVAEAVREQDADRLLRLYQQKIEIQNRRLALAAT
ncbi:MAG TPA: DNA primase [Blastocatellia bacterium]|jgi:DNA primase|nr:DNA primase [Blastocatellia bacterium]